MNEENLRGSARQFVGEYGFNATVDDIYQFCYNYEFSFSELVEILNNSGAFKIEVTITPL